MVVKMRAMSHEPVISTPHNAKFGCDSFSQEVRIDPQSTSKYTSNPTILWHVIAMEPRVVISFVHICTWP